MSSANAKTARRRMTALQRVWGALVLAIVLWGSWVAWITSYAWQTRDTLAAFGGSPSSLPERLWPAAMLTGIDFLLGLGALFLSCSIGLLLLSPPATPRRWAVVTLLTVLIGGDLVRGISHGTASLLLQNGVQLTYGGVAYGAGNAIVAVVTLGSALAIGGLSGWILRGSPPAQHGVRDINVRRGASETRRGETDAAQRAQAAESGMLMLGTSPIRPADEVGHILVSGSPGTGKSVALHQMLGTLRKRDQSGICIDWDGLFLSRHFRPGDVIFNPWDRRGLRWSPFAEIREEADCDLLARMLVPPPRGGGKEAEWAEFAGKFVAALLRGLRHRRDASPALLHDAIFAWPADKLAPLLKGTSSEQWMDPKNAEFFGSARGSAIRYLSFLKTLGDTPAGEAFSIRDWVEDAVGSGTWLFLSCRNRHRSSAQQIVSGLIALAITETLDLPETHSPQDRLWYFCDEIDQSGYIAEFEKGLTLARKHGGAFVLGMQTVGQLAGLYGEADAKAIRGSCNTQVALRCSDPDTAEAMSRVFGDRDINREMVSHSLGRSTGKHGAGYTDNTSHSIQVVTERAVSAGEIQFLPDLHGYVKHKTGYELTKLAWETLPIVTKAYEEC